MKRPILLALTALGLAAVSQASVTINVNTPDGATISGEHKFVVRVQATNLVTQVEMYVGDSLRGTDDSTPYEFTLDTLTEKEGDFAITFAAYTEEGENAKKTFTYKIDNGLSKGAAFHVEKANEALVGQKWDEAIASARIALQIDGENRDARYAMARANYGKRVLDLAQKFAEDILAKDERDIQALNILAAINIERAFGSFGATNDRMTTINSIANSLRRAGESRRTVAESSVDGFGEVTDANLYDYLNLLNNAGRYSLIVERLAPVIRTNPKDTLATNWVVYAQMRAGRFGDAAATMRIAERTGAPDGYTYALKAILYQYVSDEAKSLDAEREAILNDPSGLGVKYAQVYNALRRENAGALSTLLNDLQRNENPSALTDYYEGALLYRMGQTNEAAETIKVSLLADSGLFDVWIERGNQVIGYTLVGNLGNEEREAQRTLAKAFFDAALAIKPDSFQALTGQAVLNVLWGKPEEAERLALAATRAAPEYAAGWYVLSAAQKKLQEAAPNQTAAAEHLRKARESMTQAEKMDAKGLGGKPIPTQEQAWRYFYLSGRVPLIIPPVKA